MKYFSQTFSYLKKHLLLFLAVMAIPSIAACFLSTPYWEVSFAASITYDPGMRFSDLFFIVFDDYWLYVWPVVLISALQICAASLIMSAVDRHFRTGKLSLRSPFRLMNISIVPILFGVLIMSALGIVWRFVLYGLISLVQAIASGTGMVAGAALTVMSVIAVGLFFVHVLIIMPMLYWAPLMFVYGYRLRDAAAQSFKLISGKKVFWGLFLPLLVCAGLQLLMGYLGPHIAVSITVNFIVFLFTNVYVTVYVIVSFYNISDLDRRDVVTYAPIVTDKKPDAAAKPAADADKQDKQKPEKQKPEKQKTEKQKPVKKQGEKKSSPDKKHTQKKKQAPEQKENAPQTENAAEEGGDVV